MAMIMQTLIIFMLKNSDSCCQIVAKLDVDHSNISEYDFEIIDTLKKIADNYPTTLSNYDHHKLM